MSEEPKILEYGRPAKRRGYAWLKLGGAAYGGMVIGTVGFMLIDIFFEKEDPEGLAYAPLLFGLYLLLFLIPAFLLTLLFWWTRHRLGGDSRRRSPNTACSAAFVSAALGPLLEFLPGMDQLFKFWPFVIVWMAIIYLAVPYFLTLLLARRRII